MNLNFSGRREVRYGVPAADQVLFNRHYVLGYSFYFRQAKWALEIVDPDNPGLERMDNFRPDFRIPEEFRPDLVDYIGSGFDRGHLIASANQRETELQNSETFLLSNMSPQAPGFNRGIWRELENAIRALNNRDDILETFVICGPIFYFDKPVISIGEGDDGNDVSIPVPNAYFKSVLTEDRKGRLHMWSFIFPNDTADKPVADYQVPTAKVEKYAGIKLWETLVGKQVEQERGRTRKYFGS
ncbi:DNA/RNA non-specific endonuclease [Haliea sp. E17]|uniref:DNA/RNA non-specific endonuclease n=1 Tax=Haliea sp. E17 TaxID=3401576 RepID=UPI003AAC5F9A